MWRQLNEKIFICTICLLAILISGASASELDFKPVDGGKFIYSNNPEGIQDDIEKLYEKES